MAKPIAISKAEEWADGRHFSHGKLLIASCAESSQSCTQSLCKMKAHEAMTDIRLCTFSLSCLPDLRMSSACSLAPSLVGQVNLCFARAEDAIYKELPSNNQHCRKHLTRGGLLQLGLMCSVMRLTDAVNQDAPCVCAFGRVMYSRDSLQASVESAPPAL